MTPASFFTGAPPGRCGHEKKIEKAPSVTGGAQKILVRGIQRTRNLFGSPAQGGLNENLHTGRAIETAHRDHPKTPHAAFRSYEWNISRLNGSCLCAISQLPRHAAGATMSKSTGKPPKACLLSADEKSGLVMMARVAILRGLQSGKPGNAPEPRKNPGPPTKLIARRVLQRQLSRRLTCAAPPGVISHSRCLPLD
jgi:hypothetical protein